MFEGRGCTKLLDSGPQPLHDSNHKRTGPLKEGQDFWGAVDRKQPLGESFNKTHTLRETYTPVRQCRLPIHLGHWFLVPRFFFFGSDLGKPAEPSYQTVLERVLGIRNQSSPVSHSSVW